PACCSESGRMTSPPSSVQHLFSLHPPFWPATYLPAVRRRSIPWWRCGTSEKNYEWITARSSLRAAAVTQEPGIHIVRGCCAGTWYWRNDRSLQHCRRGTASAIFVSRSVTPCNDLGGRHRLRVSSQ